MKLLLIAVSLLVGSLVNCSLLALHFVPGHSIVLDPFGSRDSIARVGIYGDPYHLMGIELYVKALGLIDAMPDSAIKALAGCGFNGTADAVKARLKTMVVEDDHKARHERRVYLSAVVADGVELRKKSQQFNIVLHEAWLSWLQDKINVTTNFNAGLFGGDGIIQGDIAFNRLAPVEVNPHGTETAEVVAYSPNNAKFGVEPGRGVVSFWVVACAGDRVLISYQVLLLKPHPLAQFKDIWQQYLQGNPTPQVQMNRLGQLFQNLSSDALVKAQAMSAADAAALKPVAATLAPLCVVPQKQPAPAKVAQETKRVVAERAPAKAQTTSSDNLALLHGQLLSLLAARG